MNSFFVSFEVPPWKTAWNLTQQGRRDSLVQIVFRCFFSVLGVFSFKSYQGFPHRRWAPIQTFVSGTPPLPRRTFKSSCLSMLSKFVFLSSTLRYLRGHRMGDWIGGGVGPADLEHPILAPKLREIFCFKGIWEIFGATIG